MARHTLAELEESPWYNLFWLVVCLAFMGLDLATGNMFVAGFMAGLAVHWFTKLTTSIVDRREEKLKALKEEETNGIQST